MDLKVLLTCFFILFQFLSILVIYINKCTSRGVKMFGAIQLWSITPSFFLQFVSISEIMISQLFDRIRCTVFRLAGRFLFVYQALCYFCCSFRFVVDITIIIIIIMLIITIIIVVTLELHGLKRYACVITYLVGLKYTLLIKRVLTAHYLFFTNN